MKCPHCKTKLIPHDAASGAKVGAVHCDGCGCCFLEDGETPRPGVPVCDKAPPEATDFNVGEVIESVFDRFRPEDDKDEEPEPEPEPVVEAKPEPVVTAAVAPPKPKSRSRR